MILQCDALMVRNGHHTRLPFSFHIYLSVGAEAIKYRVHFRLENIPERLFPTAFVMQGNAKCIEDVAPRVQRQLHKRS